MDSDARADSESHGSHGSHGDHGSHGGHGGHVGVESGSEVPARSPKGVEIQHRFGILKKSASTQ